MSRVSRPAEVPRPRPLKPAGATVEIPNRIEPLKAKEPMVEEPKMETPKPKAPKPAKEP
jgi:hypothetical protein